jgi:hypothetical protein
MEVHFDRVCQLALVSRAGFYRSPRESQPLDEEMAVHDESPQIALAHVGTAIGQSGHNCGGEALLVDHTRVARLMREDNLPAVQPRAFVATTTHNTTLRYTSISRAGSR